ncbi:MAG: hypothetical protein IT166_08345 [Bryobacterales bacterium]|nr:hypothetical protein [Bryobacterales bacterium]
MRIAAFALLFLAALQAADPDRDFSGVWNLNPQRSSIRGLPFPADRTLRVEMSGDTVRCQGETNWTYNTAGQSSANTAAGTSFSSLLKWEGSSLLINTLASGSRRYTLMDRWTLSRDRNTFTIRRQYLAGGGESESTLVYEREGSGTNAAERPPAALIARREPPPAVIRRFVVPRGTKIPLATVHSLTSKQARTGDRVYLETTFPILAEGRVVIPPRSQVAATLTAATRAGRVKGRAEIYLRFDSLTLPNGVARDLRSRLSSAGDQAVEGSEGKIQGRANKAGDAGTVGGATAAGAGIGRLGGNTGAGAAAGAAAGLAGVLLRRGPEIILSKGSGVEMVLDRDLTFDAGELP